MPAERRRARGETIGRALIAALIASALAGCGSCVDRAMEAATPPAVAPERTAAKAIVPGGALIAITAADRDLIERHLRSSLAWSVGSNRRGRYAFRRQLEGDQWITGSNGYHSRFNADMAASRVVQRRLLIGIDGPYEPDRKSTHAKAGAGEIGLELEPKDDQPGRRSNLVVELPSGMTIEIFEQTEGEAREYTTPALVELEAELASVLARRAELERVGYLSGVAPEGSAQKDDGPTKLAVEDGFQGGMYQVSAWVNPGERGTCFVRAFYTGEVAAGDKLPDKLLHKGQIKALSPEAVEPESARLVGWSDDPQVRFRYGAGLTIYDGDWVHRYPARFELWFRGGKGERKLAELTRRISGWQR